MIDYQQGKIYKLVCDKTNKFYIGSTTQSLCKRLTDHNYGYQCYLLKKSNYISSYDLYVLGDVKIILIEEYPCNNPNELRARERYHIELNKLLLVNKNIPSRTKKEGDKKYKEKNKEQIAKHQKEWYNNNKEKLLTKATEYRETNKDKIKEWQKLYYQRNKEKIKEKSAEYRRQNPDANKNYYQQNKNNFKKL